LSEISRSHVFDCASPELRGAVLWRRRAAGRYARSTACAFSLRDCARHGPPLCARALRCVPPNRTLHCERHALADLNCLVFAWACLRARSQLHRSSAPVQVWPGLGWPALTHASCSRCLWPQDAASLCCLSSIGIELEHSELRLTSAATFDASAGASSLSSRQSLAAIAAGSLRRQVASGFALPFFVGQGRRHLCPPFACRAFVSRRRDSPVASRRRDPPVASRPSRDARRETPVASRRHEGATISHHVHVSHPSRSSHPQLHLARHGTANPGCEAAGPGRAFANASCSRLVSGLVVRGAPCISRIIS
jgi:hypothetical protein